MKKFICVGEPYEKDGVKKVSYKRIGEIFTAKSGKEYAKLYFMPGQLLSVFNDEKKEEKKPEYDEFGADMETPF